MTTVHSPTHTILVPSPWSLVPFSYSLFPVFRPLFPVSSPKFGLPPTPPACGNHFLINLFLVTYTKSIAYIFSMLTK
jgi:hypothetical protein